MTLCGSRGTGSDRQTLKKYLIKAQGKNLKKHFNNQGASACQGRGIFISTRHDRSYFNGLKLKGQLEFPHLAAQICHINTSRDTN